MLPFTNLMIEKLLGARYQVIQVLGSGGFSQTFVAADLQRPGHPRCVVKQFKPVNQNPAFLPVARRLFYKEAETLENLGQHDQIPRLLAYFEEDEEFYLVQEFIDGHSLSSELKAGEKQSEADVIALLEEVLKILDFVHAQGVIHRDIKASNLIRRHADNKLVLIDFGAVKAIGDSQSQGSEEQTSLTVGIGTKGYMPREQLAGYPQFNSDIYALGMLGIKALTGKNPVDFPLDFSTSEIIWRDRAQVSPALGDIIDKMVRCYFGDRYQSASEVLEALQQLNQPKNPNPIKLLKPRIAKKYLVVAGAIATLGVVGFVGYRFLNNGQNTPPSRVEETAPNQISYGEAILTFGNQDVAKQEGIEFFDARKYPQAVKAFEAARKANPSDPEVLIYLNNSRIGNNKSYAIAAAVPVGNTPDTAAEILRGVAQVQNEINQQGGINGIPLKVAIANDNNQPDIAKSIARSLANNPEILGVVGHGISDTTFAAGSIYQKNELVAIAPISSAVQLLEMGEYVFRTMPSDRYTARSLSNYMLTQLKKQKAVVFYNSNSIYSQSLKTEFKDALFYTGGGGQIINEFDLSRPDFNARSSVESAINKGAQVLVLLPSADVSDRALQVVTINRKRISLLAGDSFYTPKTLEITGQEAVGMVLAIPGELVGEKGKSFRSKAMQLWGETSANKTLQNRQNADLNLLTMSNQNGVNWRTALAYDATQALVTAIAKDPTRRGIQRSLTAPNFSVLGATGQMNFRTTGDREAVVQLVRVTPTQNGYKFKPIK
jgi:eukaryotic-like serine/threonine-protein kinase